MMRHVMLLSLPLVLLARLPDYQPEEPWLYGKPGAVLAPAIDADSLHDFDVRHYRLDFELPMTNIGYSCRERLEFVSRTAPLETLRLDFDRLVCDSVRRDGLPQSFAGGSGRLKVALVPPLPQGESAALDIFFHRETTVVQAGYFFARPPTTRYAHGMTCGCPTDNHYWFACWDHPMDKADRGAMMNFVLPDTFQVCANGRLDSVTTVPGGKKRWWWRHPFPIAAYLMTFSASRFSRWDTTVTNPGGETVPLIYYQWPEDSAATRTGYRMVPDMMRWFSDTLRFGPYPFERFGHVPGYYGFPWGGMEHQTQVMLHTSYIGGGAEATISHELSHMWWGDMVTHVGYADVWLNEGFATWAECQYMGHLNGRPWFQNYIAGKARNYFSQARSRDFPVYNPAWNDIYNYGVIYCKGGWVMRMLQYVTGDTAWERPGILHRALRNYRAAFPYGTVSTADWQEVVEQTTGLDLDWFFDEWIYSKGYPSYTLGWTREPVGDSFRVITELRQNNRSGTPPVFHVPVPVRFNFLTESLLVTIHPESTVETDTFMFGSGVIGVALDPDNWLLDSAVVTGIAAPGHNPLLGPGLLSIAPNPARGTVRFLLPAGHQAAVLRIFDHAGRLVRALAGQGAVLTIRAGSLPAGVYYAQLVTTNTGPLQKFVLAE